MATIRTAKTLSNYMEEESINQSLNLFAHNQHKMTIKHKSKTYKAQ